VVGVPVGGAINQVLAKASATNYDTVWVDQTGGGGGTSGTSGSSGSSGTVITYGTASPSGGNDGDIYLQYTP
jgi:hypothetical protein